jgi:hypothetical protein
MRSTRSGSSKASDSMLGRLCWISGPELASSRSLSPRSVPEWLQRTSPQSCNSPLRGKVEASGHKNIECVSAGFLTYEHSGEPVDFAYSRYALHHLPDFWKVQALVRLGRFMRPGAVLRLWDVVYSFQPDELQPSRGAIVRLRYMLYTLAPNQG